MKFRVTRYGFDIIPEDEEDVAFIEDTLGLRNDKDFVQLRRVNAVGVSSMGYLQARKEFWDNEDPA